MTTTNTIKSESVVLRLSHLGLESRGSPIPPEQAVDFLQQDLESTEHALLILQCWKGKNKIKFFTVNATIPQIALCTIAKILAKYQIKFH